MKKYWIISLFFIGLVVVIKIIDFQQRKGQSNGTNSVAIEHSHQRDAVSSIEEESEIFQENSRRPKESSSELVVDLRQDIRKLQEKREKILNGLHNLADDF